MTPPATGAELLAQVRRALTGQPRLILGTLDALDGCVLLTAAEAEKVQWLISAVYNGPEKRKALDEALALLSPAGKDET